MTLIIGNSCLRKESRMQLASLDWLSFRETIESSAGKKTTKLFSGYRFEIIYKRTILVIEEFFDSDTTNHINAVYYNKLCLNLVQILLMIFR